MQPPPLPVPGNRPGMRVRVIPLQVETLDGGGMRLSTPLARGWSKVARTSTELSRVVQEAFLEVSCASYARARGERYDLDALTIQVPGDPLAGGRPGRERTGRTTRRKSHAVEAWTRMDDGTWRSPAGRFYSPDTTVVRNVVAKRERKGLPT
jgi:hypothetical protein